MGNLKIIGGAVAAFFVVFFVWLTVSLSQHDTEKEARCRARGYDYIRLHQSRLCAKPGTILEDY
jgi:hypothetical protein